MRGYAICTSPRAGSNYLCQLLTSTEVLGRPLEYFNTIGRRTFDWPDYPDDPHAQLRAVTERGATSNGVYGLKLFAHQAQAVRATAWAASLPALRFIHLRRRDLLGQAISWVRAEQTGRYRAASPGIPRKAVYNGEAISRRLDVITGEHASWSGFFARAGIRPLELVYEQIAAGPQPAVDAVARLLDAPPAPVDLSAIDVAVQRDGATGAWRRRFREQYGDETRRRGPEHPARDA